MRIDNLHARSFYEIECVKNNWSTRELERQKGSFLFERLALSKDKKGLMRLARRGQELRTYEDMIKDPYILEFTGLSPQSKLYLELGKGFTFGARQKRISLDGDHFYIDLVFYNTILKCYVLIDLKIGRLVHQDIGQMQMYVNYYDREMKQPDDNPSVGLILCEDKKESVVRYTLAKGNKQIFASRYKLYLPTEKELIKELKKERFLVESAVKKLPKKKDILKISNSFGPNVSLAKDLLEKGERDTVVEYFEACKKFWKMDRGILNVSLLRAVPIDYNVI